MNTTSTTQRWARRYWRDLVNVHVLLGTTVLLWYSSHVTSHVTRDKEGLFREARDDAMRSASTAYDPTLFLSDVVGGNPSAQIQEDFVSRDVIEPSIRIKSQTSNSPRMSSSPIADKESTGKSDKKGLSSQAQTPSNDNHLNVSKNVNKHVEELPFLGYTSAEEMAARSERFPSVSERIKVYMSNWYLPPCNDNPHPQITFEWKNSTENARLVIRELPTETGDSPRLFSVEDTVKLNRIFYVEPSRIESCSISYCKATASTLLPTLQRLEATGEGGFPVIVQYGDSEPIHAMEYESGGDRLFPNIPVMKKFRSAFSREETESFTNQSEHCVKGHRFVAKNPNGLQKRYRPIIWKQKWIRHFGMLSSIPKSDMPWEQKKDMAVFRGSPTGGRTKREMGALPDKEKCLIVPRCRFVWNHLGSNLVDARLAGTLFGGIPDVIDGVNITGEKMSYSQLLEYKALIMPEGNDVSTGLKWALFSNSVVLIPRPTKTAWSMEERLEPWVHYVPLQADFSDVEQKMQWILDHDEKAKDIAHRGSLWIRDLVFHPDAQKDEEAIFDEIIRRYRKHFWPRKGHSGNEHQTQSRD